MRSGDLTFGEFPHFEKFVDHVMCLGLSSIKIKSANIALQGLITMSHSASCKGTEVCAAMQRDAYPDHQASVTVMVDFSDIGGQVLGLWFSPYILAILSYGENQGPPRTPLNYMALKEAL
ncbi:hypothetical protein TNCV_2758901 [Trichonephila clavipes]|nr:hypothetical protein TNCV_2758901 [Trichonephila clavipes]